MRSLPDEIAAAARRPRRRVRLVQGRAVAIAGVEQHADIAGRHPSAAAARAVSTKAASVGSAFSDSVRRRAARPDDPAAEIR